MIERDPSEGAPAGKREPRKPAGTLVDGVVHDFNNLLTVIVGFSERLLYRLDPHDPVRRYIGEINTAGKSGVSLTHQLMAFTDKKSAKREIVELNKLVSQTRESLRRVVGNDIDLSIRLAGEPGHVDEDPERLEQVILTLAMNARRAMPEGGRLLIVTRNVYLDENHADRHPGSRPGPYVMLSVTDTGPGLDEQARSRLFEAVSTAAGEEGDRGLSSVYGIVKETRGNIWVYSELEHGTTIKVYLPRALEPSPYAESEVVETELLGGSETILVVEDEEGVRTLIRDVLESAGYSVMAARHGVDALLLAEQNHGAIDLMLTDVVMPLMSGPELVRRLMPKEPGLKVLYMSGFTDPAALETDAIQPGAPFLEKPFPLEVLTSKVREVLDRAV